MKSYLLVIVIVLVVWSLVAGIRKLSAIKAVKKPVPVTTAPSTDPTPPHDPHPKKKGVIAKILGWITAVFDFFLWKVVVVACVLGIGWLVLHYTPTIAKNVVKEAGGAEHPQQASRKLPPEDKTMTPKELMVCDPDAVEATTVRLDREYGSKIVLSDATLAKIAEKKIFFSYTRPTGCVGDTSDASGARHDSYYFWSEPGEVMEYRFSQEL